MSTYGDHTPKQELLEAIDGVQSNFELTDEELSILLAGILSDKLDWAGETTTDEIQRKKATY